jgi:phytoene/squalene synthetase
MIKQCARLLPKQQVAATKVRFYSEESMKYCINLVKENDYPGYLSCLLFPAAQRNPAFSILAFNQEMLAIRKQCNNNALAGRMR